MTTADDDRLLDELAVALLLEQAEPSATEIAAFRVLVSEAPQRRVGTITARRGRRRRVMVAAAAAAALLSVGAAGAVATGTGLPHVPWGTANRGAVPVDSPALSDAKAAMRELGDALDGSDDARVERARDALQQRLAVLTATDRAQIDRDASDLLRRADERLASRGHPVAEGTGSGGGGRPGSQSGDGHGAPGDDHTQRGGDSTSSDGSGSSGSTDKSGDSGGTSSGGDHSGGGGDTSRNGGDSGLQAGAVDPSSGG